MFSYIFISKGNVRVDQNARFRKLSIILFFIIITKLDIELLSVITISKRVVRSYFCKRAELATKLASNLYSCSIRAVGELNIISNSFAY